jgi:hypothetical protein
MEREETQENGKNPETGEQGAAPRFRLDQTKMKTSYANVCNVSSTREEVSVVFGTNQTANVGDGSDITVELMDRIILNPHAAKRFSRVLNKVIKDYESVFGNLAI